MFHQSSAEVAKFRFYLNVYTEYRLNFMVIIWDKVYDAAKLSCTKWVTLSVFCVFITIPCL